METNNKFKVGDKVTIFSGFTPRPIAVRLIEKISEKRGDITLENYETKFQNGNGYGSEIGGGKWHKGHISYWKQEDSDTIKRNNLLGKLKKFNMELLSNEELDKVMEIMLPIINRAIIKKEIGE